METAYLYDLYAERLEPGQEPVQGGLILQGAVQDGFDRLHRGVEPLEVQQGFGREDPDYADLVVGRQRSPQLSRWARAKSPRSRVRARGAPCTTGESVTAAGADPAAPIPRRAAILPGRRCGWSGVAGITRGGWGGAGAGLVDLGPVLVA
jgi:hypothetical protein